MKPMQCDTHTHTLLPTTDLWYLTDRTNFTASLTFIFCSYFANRVLVLLLYKCGGLA